MGFLEVIVRHVVVNVPRKCQHVWANVVPMASEFVKLDDVLFTTHDVDARSLSQDLVVLHYFLDLIVIEEVVLKCDFIPD